MLLDRLLLLSVMLTLAACSGKEDFGREATEFTPKAEIRTDPKQAAKTLTSLGQAYLTQGKLDLAMDKLTKAIELDPKNADTHTVLAVAYEQIAKTDKAEHHYRMARKFAPETGLTANNLGRFLCSQGKYADADRMFGLALEDPFYKNPETAKVNRAVCRRQAGDTEGAAREFREVLALRPNDSIALWSLAELSLKNNELMRARAFFERWMSGNQVSPEALSLGIEIEQKLGNRGQVNTYRKQLIDSFPESEQAAQQSKEGAL